MFTKEQLCQKITEIFPDIGACGIDVDVNYDEQKKSWVVDLEKEHHHLKTFLEENEAQMCIDGKQCVSLGLEIAQLRKNIETV